MWLYAIIALPLLAAIGMQVWYLRAYASQASRATRVVTCVNIALLTLVLATVIWFAIRTGGV